MPPPFKKKTYYVETAVLFSLITLWVDYTQWRIPTLHKFHWDCCHLRDPLGWTASDFHSYDWWLALSVGWEFTWLSIRMSWFSSTLVSPWSLGSSQHGAQGSRNNQGNKSEYRSTSDIISTLCRPSTNLGLLCLLKSQ